MTGEKKHVYNKRAVLMLLNTIYILLDLVYIIRMDTLNILTYINAL